MRRWLKILLYLLQGNYPEARNLFVLKVQYMWKRYYRLKRHEGFRVMNEEWDYLIILDACRYDYFERIYRKYLGEGKLEPRLSLGTTTSEWLIKNFTERYDDVVYVSSNPHCSDHEIHDFLGTRHFHAIEHVWKYAWNDNFDTVLPESVHEAALKMRRSYPDKRMIIHYIQPHGPWVGKTRISVEELSAYPRLSPKEGRWKVDNQVWQLVRRGKFDIELLKQADLDNLEFVLEDVRKLVDKLDGRIVISADHGEGFGEKLIYGHPPGIYTRELAQIPWLVIDKGKRQVKQDGESEEQLQPETGSETDDEVLARRLRALGYMD